MTIYKTKTTPVEDFKRFEEFIDGMENTEYEYWIYYEATNKQRTLALQLREEVEEDDLDQ